MDNLGEYVYVIAFVVFVLVAVVRRLAEGRDVAQRNDEGRDWTVEELPEETRRMLFGDTAAPTAKPAQTRRAVDPFDEPRKALVDMQRQVAEQVRKRVEPPVAKPRQGAPAAPPPVPQTRQAARPAPPPPLQPQFRPEPVVQHVPAPPRHAPPAQPPRMVPQQSEGRMTREVQQQPPRPAPKPRRQQPVRAAAYRDADEGPHMPLPSSGQKQRQPAAKHGRRWLSNRSEVRRAIVLAEILGPPKALQ